MARKKSEPEEDTGGGLQVMMVSLNLILLIFFIFLNSIGANDGARVKKALGSLAGRFGLLKGGAHLMPGKSVLLPGAPLAPPEMNNISLAREIRSMVSVDELQEDIGVSIDGGNLVINLSDKLLFLSGSAELQAGADPILTKIAGLLKKFKFPIRIEGHTDNQAISTRQYPSNWELSAARATSVMRHLIKAEQFSVRQLTAVGFGETRPLVQNDSVSNRTKNRRVNIVVVRGRESLQDPGG